MKEVLTKSFWQGVRKTFYEALESPPAADKPPQAPAVDAPKTSATAEPPPPPAPGEPG